MTVCTEHDGTPGRVTWAYLDPENDTRVNIRMPGPHPRVGFLDYGLRADDAMRAVLLPTKDNRALRTELEARNARRLRRGARCPDLVQPDAYDEAEILYTQAHRVALCVVGLFNRIAPRFTGGPQALFDLLTGDPRQDIRNLRVIARCSLTSAQALADIRARWQAERGGL